MNRRARRLWIGLSSCVAVAAVALLVALAAAQQPAPGGPAGPGLAQAIAAQERHTPRLLARPHIVGTAVGRDADGAFIRVFTARAGVDVQDRLDGIRVRVAVTGPIRATHHRPGHAGGPAPGGGELGRTDAWPRPVPIGISTGRADECAAGTIGARVSKGGTVYALSNNHVYARENAGSPGDAILQPGRYDLSCAQPTAAHALGELAAFVLLRFDGTPNRVDAALAEVTQPDGLRTSTPADGYGAPRTQAVVATIGQPVQKYGRTTGLTRGEVDSINGTLNVAYGAGIARFEGQVIVRSRPGFLRSGDSGALLVGDPGRNPVGLLFASDGPGRWAIANPIGEVLSSLGGVTVDGE